MQTKLTPHDGTLDKSGKVRVWYDADIPFEDGVVHLGNDWDGGISLMASEALALLGWLVEKQVMLQGVAKEDQ